ncbi:MAG: LytR C-terminal domain-containing protein [Candidatus Daviesbacteria bacterium]|nr:LytR C-terminal domain-containing protein [Candidatus Daviesbacteria bacterium]
MDEEQSVAETENQAEEIKEPEKIESEPIKRSFIVNKDNPPMYEQRPQEKKSGKKLLIIIVVLTALLFGGYFAVRSIIQPSPPVTTTSTPVPTPAPTSQPVLNRSDWSLEILNGSGVTGAARKIADQVQILGYLVVKTGNADKDSYPLSQILVKKELESQVELVVADLKDIIKIASVAGELKDGTASARIIIGKDSI